MFFCRDATVACDCKKFTARSVNDLDVCGFGGSCEYKVDVPTNVLPPAQPQETVVAGQTAPNMPSVAIALLTDIKRHLDAGGDVWAGGVFHERVNAVLAQRAHVG